VLLSSPAPYTHCPPQVRYGVASHSHYYACCYCSPRGPHDGPPPQVYVLPDNYEVIDSSLDDIRVRMQYALLVVVVVGGGDTGSIVVIAAGTGMVIVTLPSRLRPSYRAPQYQVDPRYTKEMVAAFDTRADKSRDLEGVEVLLQRLQPRLPPLLFLPLLRCRLHWAEPTARGQCVSAVSGAVALHCHGLLHCVGYSGYRHNTALLFAVLPGCPRAQQSESDGLRSSDHTGTGHSVQRCCKPLCLCLNSTQLDCTHSEVLPSTVECSALSLPPPTHTPCTGSCTAVCTGPTTPQRHFC
jgi:hypothetical protein